MTEASAGCIRCSVARIVGMFEAQSAIRTSAVGGSSSVGVDVKGTTSSMMGEDGGLMVCLLTSDNNGGEQRDKEMAGSGQVRQRKTAVFEPFWEEKTGERRSCRSGSGSLSSGVESDEELMRFPCVERLIEMYGRIIQQKEEEMQRFMNSIGGGVEKAEGVDKRRRLDKTAAVARSGDKTGVRVATRGQSRLGNSTTSTGQQEADNSNRTRIRIRDSRSPVSDDGWTSAAQQISPLYSSDEEENGQRRSQEMKNRDKVTRSSSSDSALGLDEEIGAQEQQQIINSVGKTRRLTLGVSDIPLRSALLPVPEPALLPTADMVTLTTDYCPQVVRSKMILEAKLIELPLHNTSHPNNTQDSGSTECLSNTISRRESAQSYISDSGVDGVRYVRTPSVVVSDYSDDTMCGITLEEIEYLRRHRLRRASTDCESDISAASSCSNLNYCGSSISALEGCDYQQCGLRTPERKVSDCSTCSTLSCEEETHAETTEVLRQRLQDIGLRPPVAESGDKTHSPAVDLQAKRRSKKKVCIHHHSHSHHQHKQP
ncbi:uncharacterized protein LOC129754412 [Uranotaenia lowii]|uniref:uncharacterized protein LOC129754412 n=1 Tax=Uranotaenia lowii TaxID=190385 RepID=UPI00247A5493|nr:uncharacterized protein LOC129754412 [Uranotaenia lowii]